jgi:sugar phosphate permease
MKYRTYFITFFAYLAVHTMRMSYSFCKPYFKESFNLDNFFMGLFDGLVYISLGAGFFFRFLLEGKKGLTSSYLLFVGIASLSFSIIPVLSLFVNKADEFLIKD